MHELDAIDLKILRILQTNCRLTTKEVGQQIGLSVTPTYERQRRLERMGYIKGLCSMPTRWNVASWSSAMCR